MKIFLLTFGLLFAILPNIWGQVKYEKEYRLKQENIPEKAKNFIEKFGFSNKIKWYMEEGLKSTSIEAKTKENSTRYSVEFSNDGTIEDIEVVTNWNEMGAVLQEKICTQFSGNYTQFRIDKIQIQYTGAADQLVKLLKTPDAVLPQLKIHYEIVVMTKTEDQYQPMEFLFDSAGEIVHQSKIIQRNLNNLEY
ncbi:MAG: hypothetical protein ACI9XO_001643 [Paraglaciecola sp.]|jgi:hypothetical protein